jgi:hypothetical protein
MKTPFFPKTMGEWAYLVALIGGAMWAWTTFYLTKTYATPEYVDQKVSQSGTEMSAQHVAMMEQFAEAVRPLRDMPVRVAQIESFIVDHRNFTSEEKQELKSINESLISVRTNEATLIANLATFREDEKLIIDRLNRLIGRQKPEGLSANP